MEGGEEELSEAEENVANLTKEVTGGIEKSLTPTKLKP
jgi:hypothetical protein